MRKDLTQEQFRSIALRVGEKLSRWILLNNAAAVHKDDPVSYNPVKSHLVGNTNHCHPRAGEIGGFNDRII